MTDKPFRLQSKYAGNCDECGEPYDIGDIVYWSKAEKVCWHTDCYELLEQNRKSPIQPTQAGVTVRFNPPKK